MLQITKSVFYLMIAQGILMVSGYAIHFFLGRYLGPAQYGIYGVVIGLMGSVSLILTSGLPTALSKYLAEIPGQAYLIMKKALLLQIIFSLLLVFIYASLANLTAKIFNDASLKNYFMLSALVFPAYGLYSLYSGYYNGLHRFKKQALLQSFYSLVKAVSIILLVVVFKLYGAFFGLAIAPFIALFFVSRFKEDKQTKKEKFQKNDFNSGLLVKFALPIMVIAVFSTLIILVDLFMVKALLQDNSLAGYYTASSTIARIPTFILAAISLVIFPLVTRINKENNRRKLQRTIKYCLGVSTIMVFFAALIIFFMAQHLVVLFYSHRFLAATSPLMILSFGLAFYTLFEIMANILCGLGKQKIPMFIVIIIFPLTILLNYSLIPAYSLNGAAMATTISCLLMMLLTLFFLRREYKRCII